MRMLLHVKLPVEPFNTLVREGTISQKMRQVLEAVKPEAVYFTEYEGQRGAVMLVDVKEPSQVPVLAEPWFIVFDARVEFHVVMTPEELARAGLDELGKKWG